MSTKSCLCSFPGVSLRGVCLCLWVCLLGKFSSLMERGESRNKPQRSLEMPRTHSDFIVRLRALLPPTLPQGLVLLYPAVSQTSKTSNLDNQLEGNSNLNSPSVSVAPFSNTNNNAHTLSFCPLLDDGDRMETGPETLKMSPLLVLTSLHFFQIWNVTLKKDSGKCNSHVGNVRVRQRKDTLGKLRGWNRVKKDFMLENSSLKMKV